jgi:hypothetical protein
LLAGRYQVRSRGQANTATDGTFHFQHLPPGTYYVAVVGQPWYSQGMIRVPQINEHSELDMAYPVTYYSSSTTPEGATPLNLEEGGGADIQIALHAVPSLHIGVDGMEKNSQRTFPSLMQVGPGGTIIRLPLMRTNSELTGVAPGNYLISSNLNGEPQEVSLTSNTTLHLEDAVKTSISGKVMINGEAPPGLDVIFRDPAAAKALTANVKSDGTFEVLHATSGHYTVLLANVSDTSLEKLEVKGASYANGELDVPKGAQAEVIITASHAALTLDGLVMKDKTPVPGAAVLLIHLKHGRSILRYQSDSDGTFAFTAIPAGRYTLLAIGDARGLPYADPAVRAP